LFILSVNIATYSLLVWFNWRWLAMSVSKLVQLCFMNTFFHNVLHLSWLLGAIVIVAEMPQKSRTSQTSMSQLLLFPNDSNSVYFIDETAHLYVI
jgi:hypothetical protein